MTLMHLLEFLVQILAAGVSCVTFGALFQAEKRHYLACGITGAAGWAVYCLGIWAGLSGPMATFAATLPLALLARIFAVRRRAPVTVFLLSGIFPLVPGAGIYYTAYYFIQGDSAMMAQKGIETFKIAVAIALGISVVLSLPSRRSRA